MADSLGSVSASSTQTQLGQLKRKIRENLEKGVYAGATGPSPEKRKRAGDSNGQSLDGPPPKRRRTSKNTDAKKVTEAGSGIKNKYASFKSSEKSTNVLTYTVILVTKDRLSRKLWSRRS